MKNTTFLTVISLAVTFVSLSACSTEIQEMKLLSQLKPFYEKDKECTQVIKDNPKYARVYEKLAVDSPNIEPTSEQLADTTKPSDEDIALGLDWYAEYEDCRKEYIEHAVRVVPELGELAIDGEQRRAKIIDEAVNDRPTFGQINHEILDLKNYAKVAAKKTIHSLHERLKEQIEAKERAEKQAKEEAKKQAEEQTEDQVEEQEEAMDSVGSAILDMISILGHHQLHLAHFQRHFASTHHFYKPAHLITETKCHYVGKLFTCKQM